MVNREKAKQYGKETNYILRQIIERSQEIMSHGPIMFSDFTGFGSDFPFILTAVNIVINTVYTTSKSLQRTILSQLCSASQSCLKPLFDQVVTGT